MFKVIVGLVLAVGLFWLLLRQSKQPTGLLGRWMMRVWNRAYLPMTRWALGLLPAGFAPAAVLDIGMGNGASTRLLAGRFAGAAVTGVDLSPTAVEAAEKANGGGEITFRVADVQALPFVDGGFVLATGFQTHFHWKDLDAALAEVCRVLRPGGVLLLAAERNKIGYFIADKSDKNPEKIKTIKNLAEKTGFARAEVRDNGGWTAWVFYK